MLPAIPHQLNGQPYRTQNGIAKPKWVMDRVEASSVLAVLACQDAHLPDWLSLPVGLDA